MSDIENKNFSFRAVVFSSKFFSVIAATMLLMLVDDGINNSANAACASMDCVTGTPRTEPQPTKSEAVSNSSTVANLNLLYFVSALAIQTMYDSNGNAALTQAQIKNLYNIGVSPQQLYDLTVTAGFADSSTFYAASCAVFWCSLASPPATQTQTTSTTQQGPKNYSIDPKTNKLSVQHDLLTNGIDPTETPYPMKVCDALLVNGQNLCTEQTVTAAVAALALGLIGGIIAIVQTEINNNQNTFRQRQNTDNLLKFLLLTQQKNGGGGGGYVPPG